MTDDGALYKPYPIGSALVLRLCHSRFHLFIIQKRKMTHILDFMVGTFPASSLNFAYRP